jgi:hypothetical protein
VFGFIAESVFTFIPEHCSGSSWNAVRNKPGIAFPFTRIPTDEQPEARRAAMQCIPIRYRREQSSQS